MNDGRLLKIVSLKGKMQSGNKRWVDIFGKDGNQLGA